MRVLFLLLLAYVGTSAVQAQLGLVQFIHNAPDAGLIDVYIDDSLLKDDLVFRAATPFLAIAHGRHKVDIVPGNSADNSTPLWTDDVIVIADKGYIVAAQGYASDLKVTIVDGVRLDTQTEDAEFIIIHGAPDIGPVDIRILDPLTNHTVIGLLANNLNFEEASPYQTLSPSLYTLEITDPTNSETFDWRALDLQQHGGTTFALLLSGPGTGAFDGFGLVGVEPNGTVFLPEIPEANEKHDDLSTTFTLGNNFPNPITTTTQIDFVLSTRSAVHLAVYDMLGRAVAHLVDETLPAGPHQVQFNPGELPNGVYTYRLTTAQGVQTRNLVLVR